jgi:hypothetical protein
VCRSTIAGVCAAQHKRAASVCVRVIRSTSYEHNYDLCHRGSAAGVVPHGFHQQRWHRSLRTDHCLGNSKNDIVQRTCNQISDPNHGGEQNKDLDCAIWGIKRPDGKFVFPVGENEAISQEKLSKFALSMETASMIEGLAFRGRSNDDVRPSPSLQPTSLAHTDNA